MATHHMYMFNNIHTCIYIEHGLLELYTEESTINDAVGNGHNRARIHKILHLVKQNYPHVLSHIHTYTCKLFEFNSWHVPGGGNPRPMPIMCIPGRGIIIPPPLGPMLGLYMSPGPAGGNPRGGSPVSTRVKNAALASRLAKSVWNEADTSS